MARTKVESPGVEVDSWDGVDSSLSEIAVLSSKIASQDAKYNEEEQKRRAKVTSEQQPMKERIEELALGVKNFCENNRADFGKAKSKELKHGIVSFRLSPPAVKALKGFTLASALELVKRSAKWCGVFIRTKEELNKEEILNSVAIAGNIGENDRAITDSELKTLGLQVVQDETFGYDCKLAITN